MARSDLQFVVVREPDLRLVGEGRHEAEHDAFDGLVEVERRGKLLPDVRDQREVGAVVFGSAVQHGAVHRERAAICDLLGQLDIVGRLAALPRHERERAHHARARSERNADQ